ncbi:RHS repeat domain-containing protein [Nonomuraea sp. NPDC004354]
MQVERTGGTAVSETTASKLGSNTFGRRTEQIDAEGRTTTTTYDRAGRLAKQTFPT